MVKKDLPEPDGPRINLFLFVMVPFFIGRSEDVYKRQLPEFGK